MVLGDRSPEHQTENTDYIFKLRTTVDTSTTFHFQIWDFTCPPCVVHTLTTSSTSSSPVFSFSWACVSVFILSWADSLSLCCMHACILPVYAGIDSWLHRYATGCRKWINGFTETSATLIYPVSVPQWWDVKAYCQVILMLFFSALFDSSQYFFFFFCHLWLQLMSLTAAGS